MKKEDLGFIATDILLPKKEVNAFKWASIACDQYTAEREYWAQVENIVASDPSTAKITFAEVYLEDGNKEERIKNIVSEMNKYLEKDIFDEYKDSFIFVKRETESGTRYGIVGALDLEKYDYSKDSKSLVRATEGTILERIPPRKEIRKDAPLELPHIMVLISDEKRSVIEPFKDRTDNLKKVYSTPLMLNGGYLEGYLIEKEEDKEQIYSALEDLYNGLDKNNPLLFAMGDGNHSLATAKSCYEDLKKEIGEKEAKKSASRYALVEIENIYDDALLFEPIHRIFYSLDEKTFDDEILKFVRSLKKEKVESLDILIKEINREGSGLKFGIITQDGYEVATAKGSKHFISASLMQSVIDSLKDKCQIDYVHGSQVVERIAKEDNNIGVILPDVDKSTFFETVIKEGSFPRKTFSIGHANEKRYYMEARKITR